MQIEGMAKLCGPVIEEDNQTLHITVLMAWQAKPPRIAEGKLEPASVSTEALRDQAEREALETDRVMGKQGACHLP